MVYQHDAMKLTVSHLALTIPETVYCMFQLTFAIITPALIAGSFADRMKFSAMLIFIAVWLLVVYCPIAHWVWEPSGWLAVKGVLDFAGGTVVHINAGIAGLASCMARASSSPSRPLRTPINPKGRFLSQRRAMATRLTPTKPLRLTGQPAHTTMNRLHSPLRKPVRARLVES
jgi:hypothetical protein